jgi:hypothetical protein
MSEKTAKIDQFNAQTAADHFSVNGIPVFAEAMSEEAITPGAFGRVRLDLLMGSNALLVDWYWVRLCDQGNDLTTFVRGLEPDMPAEYNNLVGYHKTNARWGVRWVVIEQY